MRMQKWLKRGLILVFCLMLAVPVVDLSVGPMVVRAVDMEDRNAAKAELLIYYENYKDEIANAGNMSTAKKYLEEMIGDLNDEKAGGVLEKQTTESGIDTVKELVKAKLQKFTESIPIDITPTSSDSNIMVGGNWVTPVAVGGKRVNVVLPVVNMGEDMARDAVVTPVISSNPADWPFEIETSNYTQTIADLPGTHNGGSDMDRRRELTWNLKTRMDAPSGYVKLTFNVHYEQGDNEFKDAVLETYVMVTGTTGTSADGAKSTPRVIVTGFTTDPAEVHAGDTFTLTLHMQNTSQATAVKNMLFDIQAASESTDSTYVAAAFLPTSGSSTVFVDSIPAGGTRDISMELEARSDLAQKPYVVTVTMDYEDENVNSYQNTANVSIPVRQEARVDISTVEVMPGNIDVGQEANVMFSIYNIGKTQLYNTNVKLEADSVSGGETYLGNIAPGATGNVDLYVTGQEATMDDGTVKILITFEDESGEETTIEETMTLYVNEPFYDEGMFDDFMMPEEESGGFPVWAIILIVLLLIAAGVGAFIFIRKRKKKKAAALEAQLLDEELMEEASDENE